MGEITIWRERMPAQQDKRKLKRRHLIYYLRVFSMPTTELLGHLVDITPEGVMIIGEKPVPIEQDFVLHMDLPSEIMGQESIEFKARSRWSRKDVDPSFYGTGFQLLDVPAEDVHIIRRLIKDFGFLD
jgi:hypothetical protein